MAAKWFPVAGVSLSSDGRVARKSCLAFLQADRHPVGVVGGIGIADRGEQAGAGRPVGLNWYRR